MKGMERFHCRWRKGKAVAGDAAGAKYSGLIGQDRVSGLYFKSREDLKGILVGQYC